RRRWMLTGRTLRGVQQTDGGGAERGMEQRVHNHHKGLKSPSEIAEQCRRQTARHTLLRTIRFSPLRRPGRWNRSGQFFNRRVLSADRSRWPHAGMNGARVQAGVQSAVWAVGGGLKDEGGGIWADRLGRVSRRELRLS